MEKLNKPTINNLTSMFKSATVSGDFDDYPCVSVIVTARLLTNE